MESFLKINPLDRLIESIDTNAFSSEQRESIGSELIEINKRYGIASFGNGLIQTVHPLQSQNLLEGWNLKKEIKDCYPFARTSFGAVYFLYRKKLGWLVPTYKEKYFGAMRVDLAFDLILGDPIVLNNACFKDIHDKVFQRLGMVEPDEIYAFVPALALGGERTHENVEKVKLREHLHFLSQL